MEIYQVLDERYHPVFKTSSYLSALEEAEILNESFEDHFYFVDIVEQQH